MLIKKDEVFTFRMGARLTKTECARLNPPGSMQPSYRCLELIRSYEKLFKKPYDDQSGKETSSYTAGATIGFGHLIKNQAEFSKYSQGISEIEAKLLFKNDLYRFVRSVRNSVKVNLTQNEFDALVMLAFNIGVRGFEHSPVLKVINGDIIKDAWLSLKYSQGHIMKGLINRRKSEIKIFFEGVYTKI